MWDLPRIYCWLLFSNLLCVVDSVVCGRDRWFFLHIRKSMMWTEAPILAIFKPIPFSAQCKSLQCASIAFSITWHSIPYLIRSSVCHDAAMVCTRDGPALIQQMKKSAHLLSALSAFSHTYCLLITPCVHYISAFCSKCQAILFG